MALNAETEAILKDLEASGFDMSSIRTQTSSNPLLENVANSKLGGGILRREEFVIYKKNKDNEVLTLQNQIKELATNQDGLKDFAEGSELYKSALETIQAQREALISTGQFDEDSVKELSLSDEKGLKEALTKVGGDSTKEARTMANENTNGVTVEQFSTALANLAGGNVIVGLQMQNAIRRATELGVEVDDAAIEKFGKNILIGLEKGKNISQIADETFDLPAKIAERNQKATQETIDSEVRKQVAEKLKEAGVSTTSISTSRNRGLVPTLHRGVDDKKDLKIQGEGGTKVINGINVPVNKHGHVEHFKLRGSVAERMNNAVATMEELQQTRPEIFEDM